MSGEVTFNQPNNVYFTFPLSICQDCRECEPEITSYGTGDGLEFYSISCKYLSACRRAFNEGRDYEISDL